MNKLLNSGINFHMKIGIRITPKVSQRLRLTETYYDPLIAELKEIRIAQGITLMELNLDIGCADGHLAHWECGMRYPSLYYLILWAEKLGHELQFKEKEE